jgi:hypothetical protein
LFLKEVSLKTPEGHRHFKFYECELCNIKAWEEQGCPLPWDKNNWWSLTNYHKSNFKFVCSQCLNAIKSEDTLSRSGVSKNITHLSQASWKRQMPLSLIDFVSQYNGDPALEITINILINQVYEENV